jgi:hypothetical protein
VRALAGANVERVRDLAPGTFAFVHARQLSLLGNAPVLLEPSDQTYEVHRTLGGDFLMLAYVSEKERTGLNRGPDVNVDARPSVDGYRHVLVAVPFLRIKQPINASDARGPYLRLVLGPAAPRSQP